MNIQRSSKESGQAMVEFVLVLPLILLMLFAIVEFGFALDTQLTVHNAAVEGARYGALGSQPGASTCGSDTVGDRVVETSAHKVTCAEIAISYPGGAGSAARGDSVVVRVSHVYTTITPLGAVMALLGHVGFPQTITMNTCSVGRLEQAPSPPSVHGGTEC